MSTERKPTLSERRQRDIKSDHSNCVPNGAGYCSCPDTTPPLDRQGELVCSDVEGTGVGQDAKHRPVIDLDLPARLVPSGTPGHHHLYLEQDISWEHYLGILKALADAGVVEYGYYETTQKRGYGSVRHPDNPKRQPGEHCRACASTVVDLRALGSPKADGWACSHPVSA